ncbi:hypothetical protein F441_22891 [Phytophthora nicotianae CJ01A1]|uniref:Uncharacterized protein n=2 Tax=Phytophthora nicotianae TaxID=4792 RepID=W2VNF0_PHYNI|nr:hypothetical protein L916_03660 [Phytophthora nicotianae]ETO99690.1 hypothetical protein F441_22891 [Phytophthora nicotianae CJ01A1]
MHHETQLKHRDPGVTNRLCGRWRWPPKHRNMTWMVNLTYTERD